MIPFADRIGKSGPLTRTTGHRADGEPQVRQFADRVRRCVRHLPDAEGGQMMRHRLPAVVAVDPVEKGVSDAGACPTVPQTVEMNCRGSMK